MNVSLYIAKRYLLSKSSNNAINFITIIAAIGVILGAASLFIVLSGFAGLKDFTLQFSSIVDPDLKAEAAIGKSFILTDDDTAKFKDLKDIALYSKIIEERVIIALDDKNDIVTLKGVDESFESVNDMNSVIVQGSWLTQDANQVVVGWGVSSNLSLGVLDYSKAVTLYVPKPGKGQITLTNNPYNTIKAVNVGVFDINEKLNDTYVFTSIDMARNLLNYTPQQVTGIEFRLVDGADRDLVKSEIQEILGDRVVIKNREQLNDALYKMLNTENLAVYLIFTLVLIIALFNVIGSIIMMILDKKKTLNTLFNLGATLKDIRRIFFLQGSLMTVVGGIIGLLIGLLVIVLQAKFALVMITSSLAYPVTLKFENFLIVFVTISVLGVMASKIASVRITKTLVEAH
ncbi:ABC transporter permease [Yeosuana sp.]|uniref:ABC transporter permease n=1 Tax=Yeosuana sp. TaxID=2529388 RepID=UPI004054CB6F|tara:strand:- start:898 stop:2103 length:1206 start_codon:yes stop_codon:yes gene_type:complete